jgi:hypothetical protein
MGNLLLNTQPKVELVGDSSQQVFLREHETYRRAAAAEFASSMFNRNKLTISVADIEERLRSQFPELAAVSVSLPLLGSEPVVYMQPSRAALILVNNGGTFVLDENGQAFIAGNQATLAQKFKLPVVRDLSGLEVQTEQTALPQRDVAFITEVAGQLRAKKIEVANITLPAGTSELEIQPKDVPYIVKFNLHGNAREEAGTFLATKNYLEGQRITPGEYIDARVAGRVYFK